MWSAWQLLSDVNRYLSAWVAIVFALAVARLILKNLYWALTIVVSPARAAWVVNTIETADITTRCYRAPSHCGSG